MGATTKMGGFSPTTLVMATGTPKNCCAASKIVCDTLLHPLANTSTRGAKTTVPECCCMTVFQMGVYFGDHIYGLF